MVTTLQSKKDQGGMKEALQKPKRCRHKKADIVAEQNLIVQSNATDKVINVGKSVTVKATFDSYNMILGDVTMPNNGLEEGSKKDGAVAKKQIPKVTIVPKTAMVMKVHSII